MTQNTSADSQKFDAVVRKILRVSKEELQKCGLKTNRKESPLRGNAIRQS